MISSSLGNLPLPVYPSANIPVSGDIIFTPSFIKVCIFLLVALFNNIFSFIAGTTNFGVSIANSVVVIKSSAIPLAIFAIMFAVAGIIKVKSAQSANSICGIGLSSVISNKSV